MFIGVCSLSLPPMGGKGQKKDWFMMQSVKPQKTPQEASRLPWPFRIVPNWVCVWGGGELSHTCVNQSLDEGYPGQET